MMNPWTIWFLEGTALWIVFSFICWSLRKRHQSRFWQLRENKAEMGWSGGLRSVASISEIFTDTGAQHISTFLQKRPSLKDHPCQVSLCWPWAGDHIPIRTYWKSAEILAFGSGEQNRRVERNFNPHLVQPPTWWLLPSFLNHSHYNTIKSTLNNSRRGSTLQKFTDYKFFRIWNTNLFLYSFQLGVSNPGEEKKRLIPFPYGTLSNICSQGLCDPLSFIFSRIDIASCQDNCLHVRLCGLSPCWFLASELGLESVVSHTYPHV